VTEQNNNNEDRPEFRVSNLNWFLNYSFRWRPVMFWPFFFMLQTLEPNESIGTTTRPDFENSQVSRILHNNGVVRMYKIYRLKLH
jgi:hypothetical protein